MSEAHPRKLWSPLAAVFALVAGVGCHTTAPHLDFSPNFDAPPDLPRELAKTSLPPYVIESPDIITIEALRVVPLPPYRVDTLDTLVVQLTVEAPGFEAINGTLTVEPDGTLNLGSYGKARVADLTMDETRAAVDKQIRLRLNPDKFQLMVGPGQSRAAQQIRGQHLVRPDGTVSLGLYGSVYIQGMTVLEAKAAVELHLSRSLHRPEVSVDVHAYNSKVYYVITDGGGPNEGVFRLPATGNETVLDAIGQVQGLGALAFKNRIWLARPSPAGGGQGDQIYPVDWHGVTRSGRTQTNYQIMPGDRVYVMGQLLPMPAPTRLDRFFGARHVRHHPDHQ